MKFRGGLLAIALACVLASPRARAEVPAELDGRAIGEVRIVGPAGAISVPGAAESLIGRPADRASLRAFVESLIATGRFADVQIDAELAPGPLVLVVRVTPRLRVLRIDVHGNDAFRDAEVCDRLGLSEGDDVDRSEVPGFVSTLRDAYADRGYESAAVDVRLLDVGDGENVVVLVEVEEGDPTEVSELRVAGELPESRGLLRSLRALEGDRLDVARLERVLASTRRRLRGAGYLEATLGEPTVSREGARATIDVTLSLGPRFRFLVFGAEPLSRDDVVDALEADDATLDAAGLATLADRAVDVFRRAGFLRAEAEVYVERDEDGRGADLVVEIERGPPVRMRRIVFRGARHFGSTYLRHQVESFLDDELRGSGLGEPVDPEVLDRLVGGTPSEQARRQPPTLYVPPEQTYYEPAFERAVAHIQSIYEADGFLDARVEAAVVESIADDSVAVTIAIEEGPQTRVHDVLITGNAVLSDRELAEALEVERGAPYSEAALEAAVDRIVERYRARGHLYATVTQAVSFSADHTNAVIELVVNERFAVRVGHVRVEGARQTRESLVRSLVALREGDLFTPARARQTEERLLELGIFGSVVVAPADAEVPEPEKDVVVTVAERLPQVLDFGAGVSTGQGVRGSFEYSYRNLFGRAITFTMRAQLSGQFFFLDPVLQQRFQTLSLEQRLERRITMSIALPILGSNPNWRTSFNLLNMRDNARTFGIDKTAFDVTFSYRPSRRFVFSLSPSLERNNVGLLVDDQSYSEIIASTMNPSLRQLLRVPEGRSTLAAFATQLIVDRRDNPFSPTRGVYLSAGVEWAHTLTSQEVTLGGVGTSFYSHHLRLTAVASTYVRIAEGVTLALQGRYGRIVHLEDRSVTFPNRQFFLGGVDTMRSYRQDAMVPQDIVDKIASGDSIDPVLLVQGGSTYLLLRSELRFPVFGSVSAAVFGEFGNLWADVKNFEPWNLRPTAGLGIRLDTPVGPIALDYGFNLLYRDPERHAVGERIGAFNFSIGVY